MITDSVKYSGILLAGGKSTRMGEDKAFLRYGNQFLYEYSLSVLKKICNEIFISTSNPQFVSTNLRIIEDEHTGIGPIGGIYSCLKQIKNKYAIILPCDLPMITLEIIAVLTENLKGNEVVIALNDQNLPEPLIGIYSNSVIPIIEKMIVSNNFKMHDLFNNVKSDFVKIPGATHNIFRNINSPKEFNSLPSQ
jgi:molybdenum cofactor guanylyltransferase